MFILSGSIGDSTTCYCVVFFYRNRSAFIVGIGFITFISWFRNTAITYFPDDDAGNERFDYFKQVVRIEKLDKLLANFTSDMSGVGVALFTFLYVDFLDTSVSTRLVDQCKYHSR